MLVVFERATLVLKARAHAVLDDDRIKFPISFNQILGATAFGSDLLPLKPGAPVEGIAISWFLLHGRVRSRGCVVRPGALRCFG